MSIRYAFALLVGAVFLVGIAWAQEPNKPSDPPVRLKKKRPRDDKPMTEPDKTEEKKKDDKKVPKKDEGADDVPTPPPEDEKEVFQRVVKNVHDVEERLAKNDLGEATQQSQRDILKDIESLIHRGENPPPQQNEQQNQNNGGGESQNQDDKQQQSGGKQKSSSSGGKQSQSKSKGQQSKGGQQSGGQKSGTRPGGGSKQSTGQRPGDSKPGGQKQNGKNKEGSEADKPGGRDGKGGLGGGGDDKENKMRDRNADQYKDVWGHLPETLRAQMDAYSKPQPFLPKYDDLIKRYYRTIAEQGRRKGE